MPDEITLIPLWSPIAIKYLKSLIALGFEEQGRFQTTELHDVHIALMTHQDYPFIAVVSELYGQIVADFAAIDLDDHFWVVSNVHSELQLKRTTATKEFLPNKSIRELWERFLEVTKGKKMKAIADPIALYEEQYALDQANIDPEYPADDDESKLNSLLDFFPPDEDEERDDREEERVVQIDLVKRSWVTNQDKMSRMEYFEIADTLWCLLADDGEDVVPYVIDHFVPTVKDVWEEKVKTGMSQVEALNYCLQDGLSPDTRLMGHVETPPGYVYSTKD